MSQTQAQTHANDELSFDPALQMARQALYRFAALSLLDPQAGSWDQLQALRHDSLLSEAASLVRNAPEAQPESLGLGECPSTDLDPLRVLSLLPHAGDKFNELFESTFGLLVSNACPPYETEYIDGKYAFQRSNALADVSGFYRAFGLTTSAARPERPDHIAQELEFMAFLVGLERQADGAAAKIRQQRQAICRGAQVRFLSEHLAWWAPAFARLLAHENPGGFYDAAGVFLRALIPAERGLLGIPAPQQSARPSSLDPPDNCEGCA